KNVSHHAVSVLRGGVRPFALPSPGELGPRHLRLPHQEEGVEHDRFSERDGQDRLDQNLRCRARITSHCFRSFHADQTDSEGGAERGQANVKACGHVILLSLPVMPPSNRYRCVTATSACPC